MFVTWKMRKEGKLMLGEWIKKLVELLFLDLRDRV
jgi:hypothetical protein